MCMCVCGRERVKINPIDLGDKRQHILQSPPPHLWRPSSEEAEEEEVGGDPQGSCCQSVFSRQQVLDVRPSSLNISGREILL